TILCCLCGRPIQPNGEDTWLETEFETISLSKRYNGYEFDIRDDAVQYQQKLSMPGNEVQNKFDTMYRKPPAKNSGKWATMMSSSSSKGRLFDSATLSMRYPSVPLVGGRNCDVDNL
ncbi:unnamed protein product, partial [Laminaria digitata]